jgi:O-antigen/teichoic acid export membrane protein
LLATNLAGWILALSDRYMIEHFRNSHEVGLYSISYSLADRSVQLIVSLMILSSAPIAMKMWETKGIAATSLFVRDLTKYYIIITLPAAVGLSLLAKPILQLLATQSFYEGYKIMPLVAASVFLFGFQRNFQLGLLFYKKTHLIMYVLLIAGLINIALNIYFIPIYGFIAAGYTTLFSYAIFAVLIIFISRKYFIFQFPFKTLLKALVSVVAMSLVVLYTLCLNLESATETILISIILGIVIYFLLLFIMKEFNKNTIRSVLLLFKRN